MTNPVRLKTSTITWLDRCRRLALGIGLTICAAVSMNAQEGLKDSKGSGVVSEAPMSADAHPSFEVVTIKPSDPNATGGGFQVGGHRILIQNETVLELISFAYAIHTNQIVNTPPWLATQRFDIVGQADVDGYANLHQLQEMLQKLLVTRFNLRFHQEKRELSVYSITTAAGGPKLTKHSGASNGLPPQSGSPSAGGRRYTNNTMSDFALGIQAFLDKPVVDHTGLEGRYDFVLRWSPDDLKRMDEPEQPPSLFAAVREQLGLKMTLVEEQADVYAVDNVEKPSGN